MKSTLLSFVLILSILSLSAETQPVQPTDTDGNGYLNISTLAHLRWLSESPEVKLSGKYELVNDIDASETRTWNIGDHDSILATPDSAMGWKPIGKEWGKWFWGEFRGNNHKISNLYINDLCSSNASFFGYNRAVIDNLYLEDVKITARVACGLASQVDISGEITNCKVSGTIEGEFVAGLVISNKFSDISGSSFVGQLQSVESAAGLAHYNSGSISNSSVFADITGLSYVGGLVSRNNGSIISSFSTGNLICQSIGGGLVATSIKGNGNIENCYSSFNISGGTESGGLIGERGGDILNCYYNGSLKVNENYDSPLSYQHVYYSRLQKSYFNGDKIVNKEAALNSFRSRTTAQMKTQANYIGWDFENIWAIDPTINDGYPYLRAVDPISSVREYNNITAAEQILLYPNPASTHITLPATPDQSAEITIIGMDGVTRFAPSIDGDRIDVSGLSAGAYILHISSNEGETTGKFVVE
jgi:hypothetical protein